MAVPELSEFRPEEASAAEWAAYHSFRRRRQLDESPDDPLVPDEVVERRLRREVELERNRLRDSFVESPAAMALLSGPDHIYTFVNAAYVRVSGRESQQLIGRSIRDALRNSCG